ncbi:unnamed protein product [Nippostrongylus brasiliensis]|uniref:MazG domain-containing protein n=1 Tax=Nippostrongylus brasiliensis TaxID=27835 RepID=A0A0N4XG30_NIPBR|nr:unnamed protein product [Nippostrongylus brasiliensis]
MPKLLRVSNKALRRELIALTKMNTTCNGKMDTYECEENLQSLCDGTLYLAFVIGDIAEGNEKAAIRKAHDVVRRRPHKNECPDMSYDLGNEAWQAIKKSLKSN